MKPRILCLFPAALGNTTYSKITAVLEEGEWFFLGFKSDVLPSEPAWEDFHTPAQILEKFRPDILIFRSVTAIYEVGLNVMAHHRGIPTVWLAHGDMPASAVAQRLHQRWDTNSESKSLTKWLRIFLYLGVGLPIKYSIKILKYLWAVKNYGNNPTAVAYRTSFDLTGCDLYLAQNKSGAESIQKFYHYPPEKIKIVGDPQLEIIPTASETEKNKILYIETDFNSLPGGNNWTTEDYKLVYDKFVYSIRNIEYPVLVRCHPRTKPEIRAIYPAENIYSGDLANLWPSLVCIGGCRSTLLGIALALDIPVITIESQLPDFPAVESQAEGLYYPLEKYPAGIQLSDLKRPSEINRLQCEAYSNYRGAGISPKQEIRKYLLYLLNTAKQNG